MKKEVEIEAKVMLSYQSYITLYKYLLDKSHDCYDQTNYYIDTVEHSLISSCAGARIRYKKNNYELTIKKTLSEGHLEINQDISKIEFNNFINNGVFPDGEIKKEIEALNIDPNKIKLITSLSTNRMDVTWKNGLLSLDKSIYSNVTDYEIEYESTSMKNAESVLKELLDFLNIPYHKSKASKIKRAFSKLG